MTRDDARDDDSEAARRIRALVEQQAKAISAKDAEAALAGYAPAIVKFDLAPPLRLLGPAALDRAGLQAWFDTWQGPIGYEVHELAVTVRGDLAFCHGLLHISGDKVAEGRADVWTRLTLCLERPGGAWRIVHEHTSVPFYMDGSYRAAVDLQP